LASDVFADAAGSIEDEGESEALDSGGEERGLHKMVVIEILKSRAASPVMGGGDGR
jgi:hypothetical protein